MNQVNYEEIQCLEVEDRKTTRTFLVAKYKLFQQLYSYSALEVPMIATDESHILC